MARKKINLAYIANDSMRKATFNKRKKGFVKKIHELSVLCGVEACAVIHNPFNSTSEVWPSNAGVEKVVERFEMLTEMEQEKKMVNHEGFIRQSILKTMESTKKKKKENAERTMKEAMFHILSGKGVQLKLTYKDRDDLCKYIDQYLKELYNHRDGNQNQSHREYGESSSAPNVMAPPTSIADVGSSSSFPNLDVFNTPQLTNESWALRNMIPSNQRSDWVSTFASNFFTGPAAAQQSCYPMMNPVSVYDQLPNLSYPNHHQYQHQHQHQDLIGYPIMAQNEVYNLNQNQQNNNMLLDHMNQYPGEMEFALMANNNHYYQHQP
ncbi:Agamous-like MADS-box protein AGL80 [Cardamine amara subsp. amara]|uniref:Agamous-like MADS-box protein AGL80 n=1 Tax=Cardamine amara subsp. amara TaxID=228776 RepID=A0ABD1AZY2_CARAN